jgi:hypothetical protein
MNSLKRGALLACAITASLGSAHAQVPAVSPPPARAGCKADHLRFSLSEPAGILSV